MLKTIVLVIIISLPSGLHAELLHGFGVMNNWAWDFSDSTDAIYPDSNLYTDIYMFITAKANEQDSSSPAPFFVASNYEQGAWITMVPDTSFEDLCEAPENLDDYTSFVHAEPRITYVVRTVEGQYVKFHFSDMSGPSPVIEYYYQTDGTRILRETIGTEHSTWGRIKKMILPNPN